MKPSTGLSTLRAMELLEMEKVFSENPGRPFFLTFDDTNKWRHDISIVSKDGCEEFVLTIIRSQKKIAKISFHHRENVYNNCLFRLDFNGVPHSNPKLPNQHVPPLLKNYAGNKLDGNHVHYYVEGYGQELSWALPLSETQFACFEKEQDIEAILQAMIDRVSQAINLSEKIVYNQNIF